MDQFTSSRLKKELQDHNPWITELELMRMRLKKIGSNLNDEYLMMHIMNNLPSAYDGLMENLEDKLDCAIEPLTLSVLRDKISEKMRRSREGEGTGKTILAVMKMKIELCLPRPLRGDAGSVESLGTRRLTVDLKIRRKDPGTQVIRMVE